MGMSYDDFVEAMKILVIAPTPFFSDRGTHIRILEEALALERLGHEVKIVTYHVGSDIPGKAGSGIDVRRIRRLLFWYKKLEAGPDWQKIFLDVMLIRKTFFLTRTWKPDILHGHLHEGALIGWVVRKLFFWRKLALVVDFHGSLTREMVSHAYLRGGWLRSIFKWAETFIDNLGDAAVTSSWENTDEVRTWRKRKDVQTILDGVNLSYYRSLPSESAVKEKFGLSQEAVIVTYAGALIPNKGIGLLIEAIPLVLQTCPETHFVIAGYPLDQVEGLFRDKPWMNQVTIISPLSYFDLPCLLWASDIGVDPKISEQTRQASGKILQYMGAGLPVVCFDASNNREYLGNGGVYAEDKTSEGLAEAIIGLVHDKELREQKGIVNHRRAEQFSWDISAHRLEEIYCAILLKR